MQPITDEEYKAQRLYAAAKACTNLDTGVWPERETKEGLALDPDLLIHIGYHKTGSSYLQHVIFQNEDLPFAPLKRQHEGVSLPIRFAHPFLFDPVAVRAALLQQIEQTAQDGRVPVLSHEGLTGFMDVGGFDAIRTKVRLHSVAPKAKVLIGIREQDSMLLSFHNQHVRRGGRQDLAEFLNNHPNAYRSFQLAHLAFHHLIGAYQEAFGKERVLVVPMEMLKQDREAYLRKILQFAQPEGGWDSNSLPSNLGAVINPSMPQVGIAIKRQINRFMGMDNHFHAGKTPMITVGKHTNNTIKSLVRSIGNRAPNSVNEKLKRRYKDIVREKVGDFYAASNRKTAEITGIDLLALGFRF